MNRKYTINPNGRVCTKCKKLLEWERFSISHAGLNKKSSVCKTCTMKHYTKKDTISSIGNPDSLGDNRDLNKEKHPYNENEHMQYGGWGPAFPEVFGRIYH